MPPRAGAGAVMEVQPPQAQGIIEAVEARAILAGAVASAGAMAEAAQPAEALGVAE